MGVGQDKAVCADDEAGADALLDLLRHAPATVAAIAGHARHRHPEAAQEIVERVAGEGVVAARCAIAAGQLLGDADVHHRRANLLDQCGKVRQAVAPGLGERRDRGRQGRCSGLRRRAVGGVGRRNRAALLQAAGERKGDGRNGQGGSNHGRLHEVLLYFHGQVDASCGAVFPV